MNCRIYRQFLFIAKKTAMANKKILPVSEVISFLTNSDEAGIHKDSELIVRAIEIASSVDEENTVINAVSPLDYVAEAAYIAKKDMGLGAQSTVSALLNIASYNKIISFEEIKSEFSDTVANIVEGLNKLTDIKTKQIFGKYEKFTSEKGKEISSAKKHAEQSENLIKLMLTLSSDMRSILLRLAFRVVLMRHLESFPVAKQTDIARETSRFYAPVAHRLGLYKVKNDLEELSMKYNEKEMYGFIAKKLNETKSERDSYIKEFIKPIKSELTSKGNKFEIKGRPKSIFSIWNKIKKQNVEFEGIYDLFAIRIILDNEYKDKKREKADCWNIYSSVTDIYTPNPKRLRDWISNPKQSGYESLHTTVVGPDGKWVEVQIRTRRMDEIAEKGHAAHWKYKSGGKDNSRDSWLAKVRNILENPVQGSFQKDNQAKMELYSDEIFVFTPDGEIRKIRNGATVLDFAYHLHSQLGSRCTGAIIDNKMVPIKHRLTNGDHIKILTSKNQKPKAEWLNFSITSKAKTKIRRELKEEQNKKAEFGRAIVKDKFKEFGIEFTDKNVNKVVNYFKFKSSIDFYGSVGERDKKVDPLKQKGDNPQKKAELRRQIFDLSVIKEIFAQKEQSEKLEEEIPVFKKKTEEIVDKREGDFLIIDQNLGNIGYVRGKCCNPIPGDEIFGFVTVTKGIKIHKMNCPNAVDLRTRYPYRIVKAKWKSAETDSDFLVNLHITGTDQMSVLGNITKIINNNKKIGIKSVYVDSKDANEFKGTLVLYVNNTLSLNEIIGKIKNTKGVLNVTRF